MQELEPRNSPLVSQIILWALFAVLAAVSVFTVLIPEIADDSNEDEGTRTEQSEQPASE
ncbi:MAG: hypothetical protein K8H88_30300 [Sandaracinaceae bacterium]|nr:hypothetical protein [Sandaracinaceae bacterium]